MKFVPLFLIGIALCALGACEKQPYSKLESMEAGHKTEHEAHDSKAYDKTVHPEEPAAGEAH